jgi:hypothetical protein
LIQSNDEAVRSGFPLIFTLLRLEGTVLLNQTDAHPYQGNNREDRNRQN